MTTVRENKNRRAVIVSLEDAEGEYRLRLDDVIQKNEKLEWELAEHYTSKIYSKNDLENLTFSDKELADFGYAILARIYAFMKRNEY